MVALGTAYLPGMEILPAVPFILLVNMVVPAMFGYALGLRE